MSNDQKLSAYWQNVNAQVPTVAEHVNAPVMDILDALEEQRKKRLYVPPYARLKLCCKFHNGGRILGHKPFFSYDYDPRENLKTHNPDRVLDEGRGLRELIEEVTKWNNAELIQVATLFINLDDIPWTGSRQYNMALGQWGTNKDTVIRKWKLIDLKRESMQKRPVYARIESLIDIPYLQAMYGETLQLTTVEKYGLKAH